MHMSLKESLTVLSRPQPSLIEQKQAVADILAKCCEIETKLGLPHRLPVPSAGWATRRLAELGKLAGQSPVVTPQAAAAANPVAPTVTAPAPAVADGVPVVKLSAYLAMDAQTRREFCQNGGRLSHADFSQLPTAAKSAFCVAGGRIVESTNTSASTAARSFGSH
jgi:hypothetical protein